MKQRTTPEFIDLCNQKHNSYYYYSKTSYTKKDNKIVIICPIHGEFEQRANDHLRGSGCKKCSFKNLNKKNVDTYIKQFEEIHGNKYDYSLVEYFNNKTPIKIICPIHGEFEQLPKTHLKSGCNKCGCELTGLKKRNHISIFLNKSISIHGDKYDYSLVEYIGTHSKVKIVCPMHGEFEQTPDAHIGQKQGCPSCFNQLRKYNAPSWKKENWINSGNQSKKFDGFKLYLIKCYNETETFYKVGRTYNTLKTRFYQLPYKYEIIKIITSIDGGYIYDLENRFKRIYKNKKYIPIIKFGGMYECFKKIL